MNGREKYMMRSFIIIILPKVVTVINSRRVTWAEGVASMGEIRTAYKILVKKNFLDRLGVNGRIILKWAL